MGWNIFGGIAHDIEKGLSTAYHATERGLYDLTRASETAGYEVGTAIRTGHFIPLHRAYKEIGLIHENVPLLGNVSGKQLARTSASYGTQALPFIGTFGHLASHPKENVFQKGSDIAFGIADVIPFAGDAISAFKKPIEEGISGVADIIQRNLRSISSPLRTGRLPIHLPEPRLPIHLPIGTPIHLPEHIGILQRLPIHLPEPRLPTTPLPTLTGRIKNFLNPISKDIRFVAPINRLPRISGILDNVAKTVRNDLRVVGVAVDEDPVHILAHDSEGILHNIAITKEGRLLHYVEDSLGGVKKIGEDVISGGEDLFKSIRNEVDHIIPFSVKLANFFKSGKLLAGLAGLGIGLSVAGGLTTPTSTTSTTSTQSTGGYSGGYSGGTGGLGQYTGSADTGGLGQMNAGDVLQSSSENQSESGGLGQYTGSVLGQMNAGNVLQSQLQSLSPNESESSQNESNPPQSQPSTPSTSSIFSNKLLLFGIIIIVIIIIIIAVVR